MSSLHAIPSRVGRLLIVALTFAGPGKCVVGEARNNSRDYRRHFSVLPGPGPGHLALFH